MHYLDIVATTRVSDACAKLAYTVMTEQYGNPSSLHALGIAAERILTSARQRTASAIGAPPASVYFTSGGTESDNTAILGAARRMAKRGKHILTTCTEHPAVRNPMHQLEQEGFSVTYLPVNRNGQLEPEVFAQALQKDTIFASVMLVNNETGAINPIAQLKQILKNNNSMALLHTDAVQGLGKLPISVRSLGVDLLSVSGHKIHAPKGVGALYVRPGLTIPPLLYGGGQENGMRSGTEGLPAIAAFGLACQQVAASLPQHMQHAATCKAYLYKALQRELPQVRCNFPDDSQHVANISSICLPGCKSEVMLRILEGFEVYVSSGSACAKGKRSTVLTACGLHPEEVDSTLRVSLDEETTMEDLDALITGLKECHRRLCK